MALARGALIGSFEHLNRTGVSLHERRTGSEFAIVIKNQVLGCLSIWGGFSQLLRHPGIGGGSCHAHLDHFPRLQFYDEESKSQPKEGDQWPRESASHAQI